MPEKQAFEQEPWTPRIDGLPLFTNSADYERSLGEGSGAPELEIAKDGPEDSAGERSAAPAESQNGSEVVSEFAGD